MANPVLIAKLALVAADPKTWQKIIIACISIFIISAALLGSCGAMTFTDLGFDCSQLFSAKLNEYSAVFDSGARINDKLLISFAREGDKVVCSDISRIARNTRDLLTIIDELQKKGVAFQSLKESIDTSTPQGQFMLTVFGALAQLERDCIRQRTEEGRRIAMQEGRITGRPKVQVDKKQFLQVCVKWRAHEITAVEAQRLTGLTSSTFYRHVKEMKI